MSLHMIEGNRVSRACNPVDSRIRAFLDGDNNGSELFAALYDHVEREPIPERLRLVGFIPANEDQRLATMAVS